MLAHQFHRGFVLCGALLIALPAAAASVVPELVGAGTISTPDDEFGIAFAPDGHTAYFSKRSPTTNTPPRSVICVSRFVGTRWSEPEIAAFSGTWYDMSVAVSADGRRIVIGSDRPRTGGAASNTNGVDLWTIDRDGDHWGEPRNPGEPLNSVANDAYPSIAADGTLYFASSRPGGKGSADIWRAPRVDGVYSAPENLADINSTGYESQPAIAPDQSFIVFASSDRSDTINAGGAPYSRPDLYVSFHTASGWSAPRHLDAPINSPASEGTPGFSADAHWLTFASDRSFVTLPMRKRLSAREYEGGLHGITNGWNNIYRVPVAAIERLRPAPAAGARTP